MTAAKKLVSGRVAIDMLAGPSGEFGVLFAMFFYFEVDRHVGLFVCFI